MVARRCPEPYKQALQGACAEYERNGSNEFLHTLTHYLEQMLCKLPVKKEDCEAFLAPFCTEGFTDRTMQLNLLRLGRESLEEIIRRLAYDYRKKANMAVTLGFMSGILLFIILI